jgi:hypothetical protein
VTGAGSLASNASRSDADMAKRKEQPSINPTITYEARSTMSRCDISSPLNCPVPHTPFPTGGVDRNTSYPMEDVDRNPSHLLDFETVAGVSASHARAPPAVRRGGIAGAGSRPLTSRLPWSRRTGRTCPPSRKSKTCHHRSVDHPRSLFGTFGKSGEAA